MELEPPTRRAAHGLTDRQTDNMIYYPIEMQLFSQALEAMSFRRLISLVSGHEGSYQKLMVGARASGGRLKNSCLVDLRVYLNDVNLVGEKWVKHQ